MKRLVKPLCLSLALLLSLTTPLIALAGTEVIFKHRGNELWLGTVGNLHTAHRIYTHPHDIFELAVQKDGNYIVFVAQTAKLSHNAYLLDRFDAKARNFTQGRFDRIRKIDISPAGDVAFTDIGFGGVPGLTGAVYLIPAAALETDVPHAQLIFVPDLSLPYHVNWSPDGTQFAFDLGSGGIYVYDVPSRTLHKITDHGFYPDISPDGKRLAFINRFSTEGTAINIISLEPPRHRLQTIALEKHAGFGGLRWTSNGKALIYTVAGLDHLRHHYVMPLDGGPREEILKVEGQGVPRFDWVNAAYAYDVEPAKKLTTLWGALKARNTTE